MRTSNKVAMSIFNFAIAFGFTSIALLFYFQTPNPEPAALSCKEAISYFSTHSANPSDLTPDALRTANFCKDTSDATISGYLATISNPRS